MSGCTMIVGLSGGLGNQLFQFAFGRALSMKTGARVVFDGSAFDYPGQIRNCVLGSVGLAPRMLRQTPSFRHGRGVVRIRRPLAVRIPFSPVKRTFNWIRERRDFCFDPDMFLQAGDSYFQGYWQSFKYFANHNNKIVGEITLPFRELDHAALAWLARIREAESVAVHVRRGDYLDPHTNRVHGVCELPYYAAAMSLVRERVPAAKFFVFSDDPGWCKEAFRDDDVNFVDMSRPEQGHHDLVLMASCRHHIIANSTFSWWGAWLAQRGGQIVVAPTPWTTQHVTAPDLLPAEWIVLHRATGADWAAQRRSLESVPISVIIPSRNRPAMLAEAVESVVAQTKKGVEIIVVLNAPTDEARKAAAELSRTRDAKVIEIPRASLPAARNAGIAAAAADWIAILDDDDIWLPGKLEAQLEAAMLTGAALVSCNFCVFDEQGEVPAAGLAHCPADLTISEALTLGNYVSGGSAALVRKSVLLKLGGFDESLPAAEDLDMWRRIAWNHPIVILNEPLVRIRRHGFNMSGNPNTMLVGVMAHFIKMLGDTPKHLQHMLPRACEAFIEEYRAKAMEAGLLPKPSPPPPRHRTGLRRVAHEVKSKWRGR
jgi:hypothetical protein